MGLGERLLRVRLRTGGVRLLLCVPGVVAQIAGLVAGLDRVVLPRDRGRLGGFGLVLGVLGIRRL